MKVRQVLEETIPEVTGALLSDFGVQLEAAESTGGDRAAVIGFSGDVLKGSMGLVVDPALLERAHFCMMGTHSEGRALDDLVGELSNQLLGRIKSALLRYDVEIYLSTPMVLRGVNLHVVGAPGGGLVQAHYSSNHGPVGVWLDVQHEAELEVFFKPPCKDSVEEGDLLFF